MLEQRPDHSNWLKKIVKEEGNVNLAHTVNEEPKCTQGDKEQFQFTIPSICRTLQASPKSKVRFYFTYSNLIVLASLTSPVGPIEVIRAKYMPDDEAFAFHSTLWYPAS